MNYILTVLISAVKFNQFCFLPFGQFVLNLTVFMAVMFRNSEYDRAKSVYR